jgi:3-dehydroquinate synthetase
MLARMKLDKKNLAGQRRLVLLHAPGQAVVDTGSSEADIADAIESCR